MQNPTTEKNLFVGQAVVFGDMANPKKSGWIVDIQEQENQCFTIGAEGMTPENYRVLPSSTVTPCQIARKMRQSTAQAQPFPKTWPITQRRRRLLPACWLSWTFQGRRRCLSRPVGVDG